MIFGLIFLLLLQGIFMLVDEFYFHRQRGLPKWEIWGHPLDTFTVIMPVGVLAWLHPTPSTLATFIGLSIFSCLFVTKDEWVHAQVCRPMEHWLHSILFILHPVVLAAGAFLWLKGNANFLLKLQFFGLINFMLFQIFYWGIFWTKKQSRTTP